MTDAIFSNGSTSVRHGETRLRSGPIAAGTLLIVAFGVIGGCPPSNQGTFTPLPRLRYINVQVNQAKARPGDRIRVSWQFENESLLVKQSVRFFTPFLLGFQQPQDFDLDNSIRNIEFDFTGPVTVILRATDTESDNVNPNLAEINVAFDINLNDNFGVRAFVRARDHVDYPRLGYPRVAFAGNGAPVLATQREINFAQYIAIYDLPTGGEIGASRNGLINELVAVPGLQAFMPITQDFRAHTPQPATEQFANGDRRFLMTQGLRFPDRSELLADFLGSAGQCDVVLFAGAIVYSGTESTVKTADGDLRIVENALNFEPIILAIDMVESGNNVLVSDVHIGNVNQGLVCSAERGFKDDEFDQRTSGTQTTSLQRAFLGAVGTLSGNIKGARVGALVRTLEGVELQSNFFGAPLRGAYVELDTIEFTVPLRPDTNLGGQIVLNGPGVQAVIAGP